MNEPNKQDTLKREGKSHVLETIRREYPYYCTNGVKHVKLVNDYQGYEKIKGHEEWTNYGSADLCNTRLKDYKPCTREEYLTAQ